MPLRFGETQSVLFRIEFGRYRSGDAFYEASLITFSLSFQNWELLVLSKLQWNVCAITGYDYVDQIIERCPWGNESSLLRRHSNTLVSISYTGRN